MAQLSFQGIRKLLDAAAGRRGDLLRAKPDNPISVNKDAQLELQPERIRIHPGGYLAVVATVRNEALDILEWVAFQRVVGVDHIYLYDDSSTDETSAVLAPFVEQGFVTLIPWSRFLKTTAQQYLAFAHALTTFGPSWRWMAFIDRDEFLFPVADASLAQALSRYEDLPAVVVPWHIFGFNGHERRPAGLVIENYTRRLQFPPPQQPEALRQWKSIVNPAAVQGVATAHFFRLTGGRVGGYTESRMWMDRSQLGWEHVSTDVFRLNHYFTQSYEDFARRRSTHHDPAAAVQTGSNWRRVQAMKQAIECASLVEDDLVLRYLPRVLRSMAAPHSDTERPRPAKALTARSPVRPRNSEAS